ncbi:MAG: sigma-54 dependent transcriptional regulator [Chromatiaceae bacterium]|nr:sigma-54 dependent transcriptional regulator [Chromatiaceae bacterium]
MSMTIDARALEKRDLLYLAADGGQGVYQALHANGWNTLIARSIEEARTLADTRRLSLGLVEFDSLPSSKALLGLAGNCPPDMHWIALLKSDSLCRHEVREEVSQVCYDYHTLPIDLDRLQITLGHALGMASLRRRQRHSTKNDNPSLGLVGNSPALKALRQRITRLAVSDAPVMIAGESGTGKELTARALHHLSRRSEGPFVAVNCGALPASLIQSELFGYERGAFSGANQRVIGKIESANRGTLFLDEIGDLPQQLQVNLLRVLQEHSIQRVGGHVDIPLDLRILAATHIDLERAVAEGRFREDLYYRLNVLHLEMPPLRERVEDIELLAEYFFEAHAKEKRGGIRGLSPKAVKAMRLHAWPGNVRELINRMRGAMAVSEHALITPEDLGLGHLMQEAGGYSLEQIRAQAEIGALKRSLSQSSGTISLAAKRLGISRATLYRLMDKHGLQVAADGSNPQAAPPRLDNVAQYVPTPRKTSPCSAASAPPAPRQRVQEAAACSLRPPQGGGHYRR